MAARDEAGERERPVPVWDRPTRVFHWVLVLLFVVCYVSADQGRFDIHVVAGQALLILVVARIAWGFLGSDTALFRNFLRSPGEIASHARSMSERRPGRHGGHNPLGGLSVAAMLLVLLLHTLSGLFAADVNGLHEGPLSFLVAYEAARDASAVHAFTVDVLLVLVALHVAAVLFHLVYKRENLVWPMVTGNARIAGGRPPPRLLGDGRALLVLLLSVLAVLGGIELAARFL